MVDVLIKYLSYGDYLKVYFVDGKEEVYSGSGKKIENNFLQVTSTLETRFINLDTVKSIDIISKSE